MSGPSFENIDRWLFEYVEGNLSHEQEKQLEVFLLQHPEFDLDLDSWQMARVDPEVYEFPNQELLYRKDKKSPKVLPYLILGFAIISVGVFSMFFLFDPINANLRKKVPKVIKIQKQNLAKNDKEDLKSENINKKNSPKFITKVLRANDLRDQSIISLPLESISASNKKFQIEDPTERSNSFTNSKGGTSSIGNDNFLSSRDLSESTKAEINTDNINLTKADTAVSTETIGESAYFLVSGDGQSKRENSKIRSVDKSLNLNLQFRKIVRDIDKFMGDEIGLKNTRDYQIHVPGLSPLDANFSSAGDISSTRFRNLSRMQWFGKENQSFTNQILIDWFSKSLKTGFGFQGNYQFYGNGVIQNWNVSFIYSPKILLSKSLLIQPGIRYKMGSKILIDDLINNINSVELERGNTKDFYADESMPIGTNQWFRDIGTSLLLHAKWFYIGAQVDNLLRHQDNIYSNSISSPRRAGIYYAVNIGTEYISKTNELSFSPYSYYEKFEKREEVWGGFNFQYRKWSFGGAVSNKSNFALSTGLRFSTFAVTYQFDQTHSTLLGDKASSHQLCLMFNTKISRSPRRYIQFKQ